MKMTALDKFKRRLVRDIARRKHQDKQPEEEMFPQLKQEYGCDCNLLWDHMKALTMKKLKRLLAAEDRMDYITKIARMTSTDWLTFDLVLAHERVDVIGEEMILAGKPEPKIFTILFQLIQKYRIEYLYPRYMVQAWFNLTIEYNTGGRQASPMLLQRRWYQLKELTRTRFYGFWNNYRGNPKLLPKANQCKPTKLMLTIAEEFEHIITRPFDHWELLIQRKQVVLAGAFDNRKRMLESEGGSNDNDPDLIVVEPHVETIELAADSDSDEQEKTIENQNENINSASEKLQPVEENVGVTIKMEPDDGSVEIEETHLVDDSIEVKDTQAISVLDNMQMSINTNTHNLEGPIVEQKLETSSNVEEEESEQMLPRITSVMGNVVIPPECQSEINETDKNEERDIILKSKVTDVKNKQEIATSPLNDNNITGDVKEDGIEKSFDREPCFQTEVSLLDQLPVDLEFVDDGIDFVENDYDTKINGEDDKHRNVIVKEEKLIESREESDTPCKIDPKLIMFPITYTKKLDDMEVFRKRSFFHVKGEYIIYCALSESKPSLKVTVKTEEVGQDESDDGSETSEVPRIKSSSWLLQKPKCRSYNPIQLCKNPDFNTRLKRLTAGFFTYTRNRQLLNACKPVTVDLHKAFEDKLVNKTLFLDSSDAPNIKQEKNKDVCENSTSVMPSAMPVQSLLDNSKVNAEKLFPLQKENEKTAPVTPLNTRSYISERSKIINLPDIEQIRRLNQNLLTAEVSPITLQNSLCNNKPPVQLVKVTKEDTLNTPNVYPESISMPRNKDKEIIKPKRSLPKKIILPKLKPSLLTRPSWSVAYSQHRAADDFLLTKDTLAKVLDLLNGNEVISTKPKKKTGDDNALKKKQEIKERTSEKQNRDITSDKNKTENVTQENKVKQLYLKMLDIGLGKKVLRQNKTDAQSKRTITSRSKFCCWARYRIKNFVPERKRLRHLCPKPICKCCCRNLLVDELRKRNEWFNPLVDYNNVNLSTDKINDIADVEDVIYAPSLVSTDGVPPLVLKDQQIHTIDSDSNSVTSHVSSVHSPMPQPSDDIQENSLVGSEDSFPVKGPDFKSNNMTENANFAQKLTDENVEETEQTYKMSMKASVKTRIIAGGASQQHELKVTSGMKSIKENLVSSVPYPPLNEILPDSPGKGESDTKNDKNIYSHIETIIIDDDETMHLTDNDSNMLLPKGVNLLLLPDNTLSISIDPSTKIDQDTLSKLPEILDSVTKLLPVSGAIQLPDQISVLKQNDNPSDLNSGNEVLERNESQTENLNNIIEKGSQNSNILRNEDTAIIVDNNCSENDDVNKETFDIIGNSVLLENTSDTQFNNSIKTTNLNEEEHIIDNITKINDSTTEITELDTSISQNQEDEMNCSTNNRINTDENSRKTILSDLMTMSGISPEDANQPIDESEPILVPNLSTMAIPSTSNTVIDYNAYNNGYMVNAESNEQQTQVKKPIKKIVISIRKKRSILKDANSVIDLTDDGHSTGNLGLIDKTSPAVQPLQPLIKKYVEDIKHKNSMEVCEKAQPLKLFKTSRTQIIKQNVARFVPLQDVTKQIKIAVNKHYAPRVSKIPTILKRSRKNAAIQTLNETKLQPVDNVDNTDSANSEPIVNRMNCETDTDSSDDEPLAKKFKRIRETNTLPRSDVVDNTHNLIPVQEYELPIEYLDEETVLEKVNEETGSDGEDNCILGV